MPKRDRSAFVLSGNSRLRVLHINLLYVLWEDALSRGRQPGSGRAWAPLAEKIFSRNPGKGFAFDRLRLIVLDWSYLTLLCFLHLNPKIFALDSIQGTIIVFPTNIFLCEREMQEGAGMAWAKICRSRVGMILNLKI